MDVKEKNYDILKDANEVKKYFDECFSSNEDEKDGGIDNKLFNVILEYLPEICDYREENRNYYFNLIIVKTDNLEDYLDNIPVQIIQSTMKKSATESVIRNLIKSVAIFCEEYCDALILDYNDRIEVGIYQHNMSSTTDMSFENLLKKNNTIICQPVSRRQVVLCSSLDVNHKRLCSFDYNKFYRPISSFLISADNMFNQWCNHIFNRIDRIIGGTICLFVKDTWVKELDDSFDNKLIDVSNIGINIYDDYLHLNSSDVSKMSLYETHLNMFVEMLNYDGATIISNSGKLMAYHAYNKKLTEDENGDISEGGARHKAFTQL